MKSALTDLYAMSVKGLFELEPNQALLRRVVLPRASSSHSSTQLSVKGSSNWSKFCLCQTITGQLNFTVCFASKLNSSTKSYPEGLKYFKMFFLYCIYNQTDLSYQHFYITSIPIYVKANRQKYVVQLIFCSLG